MSQDRLAVFRRLAWAKNAKVEPEQIAVYVEETAQVPVEVLTDACRRLIRAATYGLPSIGDVLLAVDDVQRARIAQVKTLPGKADESDRRAWVHCRKCNDEPSAWLPPMWCQGSGAGWLEAQHVILPLSQCGRSQSHAPHSFTERCECHQADWRNERRMQSYGENLRAR